jgi:eukaryotic-like serine/threonine-protein kinase
MTAAATAPRTVARYRLEQRIGAGTVAEAWRAKSFGVEGFEKTLVVKLLLPELAGDAKFVENFVHEVELAVRLSHANVVQVFDLGRVEDGNVAQYYLAMEHVAGRDLASLLADLGHERASSSLGFALYVASEVAKALDHAHRRRDAALSPLGIVHADLSPENVLLSWEGEVKVSDFCVARALYSALDGAGPLSHPRLRAKLSSASPELARGEQAGAASDVFALGVLLYQLVSGAHPFAAATAERQLAALLAGRHRPLAEVVPGTDSSLSDLVERALALDPRARPGSSAQIYEELVALRYSLGARYGEEDLAELLAEEHESAPISSEAALELLETTRDVRVPAPPMPSLAVSAPPPAKEPSVLGPLGELKSERDVSVLVVRLGTAAEKNAREHVAQLLRRYGGKPLSESANEVAAVFGHETSDGRDTENAVRAALVAIRSAASSEASAGVEVGKLSVDADGSVESGARTSALLGQCRRLTSLSPRRVAVSFGAARSLRGLFELDPAARGAAGAKVPFLVGELRSLEAAFGRFVGRKTELRRFGELLARAGHRELQIVGITGREGVGKTRLVYEAMERIARGSFNVGFYVARCLPRGREVPESGVTAMLRTLCGVREGDPVAALAAVEPRLRALGLVQEELDAVLGALGAPRARTGASALGAGLARMLLSLAEDRLHVLAWDDAHELDEDSGALLASVAERSRQSRMLMVFAGRPRSSAPYRRLPGFSEISLEDLPDEDMLRLVAARVGVEEVPAELSELVRQRAGGHPMFVEELTREARDSGALVVQDGQVVRLALDGALAVPRPLRTLLSDRVRRLPEPERDLLVAAAVLGTPVDVSVLAVMLDLPISRVNALAQALTEKQLLTREDPVTLGFATATLPEVVLGEIEPDARVELHRAAANAYPMVLGPDTEQEAARIAQHFAEAGESARAAGFFATSAFYHLQSRRLERAARDFTRALELADLSSVPSDELTNWVAGLTRAVRHVRSGEKIPELVQRISLFLRTASGIDPATEVRLSIDLGIILGSLSRYKDATRLLSAAARRAREWPELERAALMAEAELASRQGEFKLALSSLTRLRDVSAGDAMDEHRRLLALAQAQGGAGEYERALESLDQAAGLVGDGDAVLALERAKVSGLVHGFRGDWARCAHDAALAAETARELGLEHEVAIHLHNQGDALMREDELPRAYAALTASRSVAARIGAERLVNLNQMMLAYLDALNGSDAARKTLGEKLAHAEAQKWTWDALSGRVLLGKLLGKSGDVAGARRELILAKRLADATSNQLVIDDCERALAEL